MKKRISMRFISYVSEKEHVGLIDRIQLSGRFTPSRRLLKFIRENQKNLDMISATSPLRGRQPTGVRVYPRVRLIEEYVDEFNFFCSRKVFSDVRDVFCRVYYGLPLNIGNYLNWHEINNLSEMIQVDPVAFVYRSRTEKLYNDEEIGNILVTDLRSLRHGHPSRFNWTNISMYELPDSVVKSGMLYSHFCEYIMENNLPTERTQRQRNE